MDKALSERFKEARTSINIKQNELAQKSKTSQSAISEIEKGRREPSKDLIKYLISEYGINSNWLLSGIGDMILGNDDSTTITPDDIFQSCMECFKVFAHLESEVFKNPMSDENKAGIISGVSQIIADMRASGEKANLSTTITVMAKQAMEAVKKSGKVKK